MENNPYAPPTSNVEDVPVASTDDGEAHDYRDLSPITKVVSVLLLVGIGAHILAIISLLMQIKLLSTPSFTTAQGVANDERERIVSVIVFFIHIATYSMFGRWIYLAHRNLPELGARYLKFRPGWAVGTLFVPIISIWAPYQAMRDLAKASRSPSHWHLEDTPFLLVAWWTLWLITEGISNISWQVRLHAHSVAELTNVTYIKLIANSLSIPLYLLALQVVRRVTRDQIQNAHTLGVSTYA